MVSNLYHFLIIVFLQIVFYLHPFVLVPRFDFHTVMLVLLIPQNLVNFQSCNISRLNFKSFIYFCLNLLFYDNCVTLKRIFHLNNYLIPWLMGHGGSRPHIPYPEPNTVIHIPPRYTKFNIIRTFYFKTILDFVG